MKLGIVILAAGVSSRLGRAKQLLKWKGITFLERAVQLAQTVDSSILTVVIGAREAEVLPHVKDLGIPFCHNPDWSTGMGSSVKTGINDLLLQKADLDAILILLSDQVLVDELDLKKILQAYHSSSKTIIAAKYKEVIGVPVLFDKTWFEPLQQLDGEKGAGALVRQNPSAAMTINMPNAAFDIDTEADYQCLLDRN